MWRGVRASHGGYGLMICYAQEHGIHLGGLLEARSIQD